MTRRRVGLAGVVVLLLGAGGNTGPAAQVDATPPALPPGLDRIYRAFPNHVDAQRAMAVVVFMDRFWRIAGNAGFNASQDYIRARPQASNTCSRST